MDLPAAHKAGDLQSSLLPPVGRGGQAQEENEQERKLEKRIFRTKTYVPAPVEAGEDKIVEWGFLEMGMSWLAWGSHGMVSGGGVHVPGCPRCLSSRLPELSKIFCKLLESDKIKLMSKDGERDSGAETFLLQPCLPQSL